MQVRGRRSSGGSGVIWRSSGLIVTNDHVVRGSQATVKLVNGPDLDAVVIARDRRSDLAALQVEAADLPVATVSDSILRVGELVLAVGNPLGLVGALTTGIVHAVGGGAAREQWVQADVRLAPGNSGGPLANSQGHVIGINCMMVGGLALAVPSYTVEQFLHRWVDRPYLGITTQPVLVSWKDKRVVGLLVTEVTSRSPAQETGLLLGDVLIAANGQPFSAANDLFSTLVNVAPEEVLQLDLLRGGTPVAYSIAVRSRTAEWEAV